VWTPSIPTDTAHVVPFARDLAAFGDRTAVVTPTRTLTYGDLAAEVAVAAGRLGERRRLLLVAGANELAPLATYLAALATGHPVLLVPGHNPLVVDSFEEAFDPDVVLRRRGAQWSFEERREASAHRLHPDLALLLSTSGSTGSPKLVRLSQQNVQANAASICEFLDIRGTDRAATTLPLHYCYGLSVINSHLLSGATLLLTELSVVDDEFWRFLRDERATTFAGVPHTFDLLDRVGFAAKRLPHLRYITQAGGRLAPDAVRRYACLGREAGWDLFVMYGQTEATARIAYLPPGLAASHAGTIGLPIPGGSLRLEPVEGCVNEGEGELVYSGPNVMLGYAQTAADLQLGRTVHDLRTGDLARRTPEGMFEVVGRLGRSAKIFGLRLDLARVEALLEREGVRACCVDGEVELVVAVEGDAPAGHIQGLVQRACGLPARAARILRLDPLPRLPSGKPDYPKIAEQARATAARDEQVVTAADDATRPDAASLRALFVQLLDRPDATDASTFVSLGGDSLSFVEMSIRLEDLLGHLPADWHTTSIRDLVPAPCTPRKPRGTLDTSVALRASAIVLIVGSHTGLFTVRGGAHVLLGVAGFNFARFHLGTARRERSRNLMASMLRIAVPTVIWVAFTFLFSDDYGRANLLLLNSVLSPDWWGASWHLWFVEALLYTFLALLSLLSIPWLDRAERRHPFGFVTALVVLALTMRYDVFGIGGMTRHDAQVVFWIFALGWAASRSTRLSQRLLVSGALVATVPGFFGDAQREAVVIAGLLVLVWVARIPAPRSTARLVGVLASSSLYVYVTHWQVYPYFGSRFPLLGVLLSFAVGLAYWRLMAPVARRVSMAVTAGGRAVALCRSDRSGVCSSGAIGWWRKAGLNRPDVPTRS
jgi:non-ribosomal peptide synthetase component E (peptide arylation enzyme)